MRCFDQQKPDGTKVKWKISDEAIVRIPGDRQEGEGGGRELAGMEAQ
jgi:hypothetical protein